MTMFSGTGTEIRKVIHTLVIYVRLYTATNLMRDRRDNSVVPPHGDQYVSDLKVH